MRFNFSGSAFFIMKLQKIPKYINNKIIYSRCIFIFRILQMQYKLFISKHLLFFVFHWFIKKNIHWIVLPIKKIKSYKPIKFSNIFCGKIVLTPLYTQRKFNFKRFSLYKVKLLKIVKWLILILFSGLRSCKMLFSTPPTGPWLKYTKLLHIHHTFQLNML